MPFTEYTPQQEYYDDLWQLRDQAFQASNTGRSKRHHVGALSWGLRAAQWTAEDGRQARLEDSGLRLGTTALREQYPTQLRIMTTTRAARIKETGAFTFELTLFSMDLETKRTVRVDKIGRTVEGAGPAIVALAQLDFYDPAEHPDELGLTIPTPEDYMLLASELARGANGSYCQEKHNKEQT